MPDVPIKSGLYPVPRIQQKTQMVQFAKKMGKCLKFRHGTGKKERDRAYRTHYRGCKRRQPEKGQSPHKNQEVVFSLDFFPFFSYTIIH